MLEQRGGVVWERCRTGSPQFLRAVSVTRREENHAGGKAGCLRCENQFPIPSGHHGPIHHDSIWGSGQSATSLSAPIFPDPEVVWPDWHPPGLSALPGVPPAVKSLGTVGRDR